MAPLGQVANCFRYVHSVADILPRTVYYNTGSLPEPQKEPAHAIASSEWMSGNIQICSPTPVRFFPFTRVPFHYITENGFDDQDDDDDESIPGLETVFTWFDGGKYYFKPSRGSNNFFFACAVYVGVGCLFFMQTLIGLKK